MHSESHEEIISEARKEYKSILDESKQGIYIFLDDVNKICNEKFASMLGYPSANAWEKVTENFPTAFVSEKSQSILIDAYQDAMNNSIASNIKVTWKKNKGGEVNTNVILVPISCKNHSLAMHFVS